jgi:hypothetical protein
MEKTKETVKALRPEITLEILDLDKAKGTEFDGDYCLYTIIPLKRTSSNAAVYDSAFERFLKQYINDGNDVDEIIDQEPNLFLTIDGSDGEQIYFLQSFIKIDHWSGEDTECLTEQIQLSEMEQDSIDLALLPLLDKDKQQTLERIRADAVKSMGTVLPKAILNKMKLVSDSIIGECYRSAWISYDNQESIICEIKNCFDPKCPTEVVPFGFVA